VPTSRNARYFVGKSVQLIDHGVHGRADAQEFAPHRLAFDLERVERVPCDRPAARPVMRLDARSHVAVAAHDPGNPRAFARRGVQLVGQSAEDVGQVAWHAVLAIETLTEVPARERGQRVNQAQILGSGGVSFRAVIGSIGFARTRRRAFAGSVER
jgi:hypothetical protein